MPFGLRWCQKCKDEQRMFAVQLLCFTAPSTASIKSCHQKSVSHHFDRCAGAFDNNAGGHEGVCFSASSTAAFSFTSPPRRQPPSAVTTTLQLASVIRSINAALEKPPKMTECVAPIRAQASIAIASSGMSGRYSATRSPVSTPACLRTFAKRQTSLWSCW